MEPINGRPIGDQGARTAAGNAPAWMPGTARGGPLAVRRKRAAGKQRSRDPASLQLPLVRPVLPRDPRGQETVSPVPCLSRVVSSSVPLGRKCPPASALRLSRQWTRGLCICLIARTTTVYPGNRPLRANACSGCLNRRTESRKPLPLGSACLRAMLV